MHLDWRPQQLLDGSHALGHEMAGPLTRLAAFEVACLGDERHVIARLRR